VSRFNADLEQDDRELLESTALTQLGREAMPA
jgi:hypothetical protein